MFAAAFLELKAEKQSAHSDCINSVAFSPDGKTIVSGSDDQTLKVWGENQEGSVALAPAAPAPAPAAAPASAAEDSEEEEEEDGWATAPAAPAPAPAAPAPAPAAPAPAPASIKTCKRKRKRKSIKSCKRMFAKLDELHREGFITDEEYTMQKQKVLDSM